jgi:hypothetical protein
MQNKNAAELASALRMRRDRLFTMKVNDVDTDQMAALADLYGLSAAGVVRMLVARELGVLQRGVESRPMKAMRKAALAVARSRAAGRPATRAKRKPAAKKSRRVS